MRTTSFILIILALIALIALAGCKGTSICSDGSCNITLPAPGDCAPCGL